MISLNNILIAPSDVHNNTNCPVRVTFPRCNTQYCPVFWAGSWVAAWVPVVTGGGQEDAAPVGRWGACLLATGAAQVNPSA